MAVTADAVDPDEPFDITLQHTIPAFAGTTIVAAIAKNLSVVERWITGIMGGI